MTGFLDRLTAHLHGEAPAVAVRPRWPFEPDPGPGAWPGADATGPHDADHGPGRHAASGPWPQPAESGSVDFSLAGPGLASPGLAGPGLRGPGVTGSGVAAGPGLADSGVADYGLAGPGVAGSGLGGRGRAGTGLARSGLADLGLAGTDLTDVRGTGLADPGVAGPGLGGRGLAGRELASADPGNAGESAVAGALSGAGSQTAGHAVGWPPDGQSRPAVWPGQPLAPDEGPSWPALPASSRSRRAPAPTARAAEASGPSAADGAAGVELRPEDEALSPAPSMTGTDGAARAAPTVILNNSPPATAPSLGELLARHVVPALRAAGAIRSGRDTVRLTQEPVTEDRGGDVHVHLGRIEVVQPPAAAPGRPARSRPRPPAPDHEAYLARRRQDRR
jgi:hypothetical protein